MRCRETGQWLSLPLYIYIYIYVYIYIYRKCEAFLFVLYQAVTQRRLRFLSCVCQGSGGLVRRRLIKSVHDWFQRRNLQGRFLAACRTQPTVAAAGGVAAAAAGAGAAEPDHEQCPGSISDLLPVVD